MANCIATSTTVYKIPAVLTAEKETPLTKSEHHQYRVTTGRLTTKELSPHLARQNCSNIYYGVSKVLTTNISQSNQHGQQIRDILTPAAQQPSQRKASATLFHQTRRKTVRDYPVG
eukprot:3438145-Amphidinium_carterae.1